MASLWTQLYETETHTQDNDEEVEREKRKLADRAEIRALCTDAAD